MVEADIGRRSNDSRGRGEDPAVSGGILRRRRAGAVEVLRQVIDVAGHPRLPLRARRS